MKHIVFITVLILSVGIISFGQGTTRAVRVDPNPVIMTNADFEKLDMPAQIDRFDQIDDNQKKFRLDLFSGIISPKNQTIEFVIQLKGKTPKEVSKNMKFIFLYLTENKKIMSSRISFVLNGEGENITELWLIPNKKVLIPGCLDCVIIPAEDKEKLREFFN